MTRLPMLVPADLDDQQRVLYDAIAGGPRAAGPRLFAYYATLALQLRVFRVGLPAELSRESA